MKNINWQNITVTDDTPDVPDMDLVFELHDGWMDASEEPTEEELDEIESGEVMWVN